MQELGKFTRIRVVILAGLCYQLIQEVCTELQCRGCLYTESACVTCVNGTKYDEQEYHFNWTGLLQWSSFFLLLPRMLRSWRHVLSCMDQKGIRQFLEKVIDSNKLCFGGVVLPPRFDDRVISRNIAPSMMSSKNYCQIWNKPQHGGYCSSTSRNQDNQWGSFLPRVEVEGDRHLQ